MCALLTLNICLMCHVQVLVLNKNKISDAGLTAFAKAVESGALPQLKDLMLSGNKISDSGLSALAKAITPGPSGKGALPQLKELFLRDNQIGDVGMQALAGAVSKGALAPGATVYLGANSATETGKQVMRNAAKARGLSVYV